MTRARDLANVADDVSTGTVVTTASPSLGRRNIILNGDFRISQRGDYTTSPVTATHDNYWLDRWVILSSGITSTVQKVTRTINGVSRNASRILCTSGGTGIFGFAQRAEIASIPVGETLTVSCWVKTNNPNVRFRSNTFGGSAFNAPETFTSDGEWHKVYYTFDSTGTTHTFGDILIVAYGSGLVSISTNDYIEIADVQLEVGSVATPFEHISYGESLALCQRYYEVLANGADGSDACIGSGNYYTSTSFHLPVKFQVQKRTTSYSLDQVTGTDYYRIYRESGNDNFDSFNVTRKGAQSCTLYKGSGSVSSTTGNGGEFLCNNASAFVAIDNEL